MALFLKQQFDTCLLGIWQMDEKIEVLQEMLHDTTYYEEACSRFTSEHRRCEWLSVRVLLHELLGRHEQIAYLPSGRPYLPDSSWHISISHTKGYVAVLLGKSMVGLDIEQYGERVQRVAHKFMRSDEEANLYKGGTTWSLLLHWSAKEVMFKCLNASEVDFRTHLFIHPFQLKEAGSFTAQEMKTACHCLYCIRYQIFPDFVLTWTTL